MLTRRPALFLTSLAVAALGAACGREPEPPVVRPVLQGVSAAGADPAARQVRVLEQLDLLEAADEWILEANEQRQLVVADVQMIALQADVAADALSFKRRGSYDLSQIHALRLPVVFDGSGRLVASFLRDGEVVGVTEPVPLRTLGELHVVELTVPTGLRAESEPCDLLVLHCRGNRRVLLVRSVELIHEPLAARLPDPAAPELVRIGDEARRAVGVISGRPVETRLRAAADRYLTFAYGQPEDVATPTNARLVVTLSGTEPDSTEVRRLPLGESTGWQDITIDLARWNGESVVVRWEIEGTPGGVEVAELACAVTEAVSFRPDPAPVTVVLITSDTHRGDHLGLADGGVEVATPALDALGARGTVFSDCLAPTNVTLPSHVALMTGRPLRDTHVLDNYTAVAEAAPTLAEAFRDAGFGTFAAVSVAHLAPGRSGLGQGFDAMSWPTTSQRPADAAITMALEWLEQRDGRPVFLWLHVFDAHWPYDPPADVAARYYDPASDPSDPALPDPPAAALPLPGDVQPVRDMEYYRAMYRAEIDALDSKLAPLLSHPAVASGIVALVADHGESLGEHDVWFRHMGLYPGVLHIPLVLAGAGVPAGQVLDAPVTHLDLGRTLLDLAGAADAPFPGRSLLAARASRAAPRFALAGHGTSASVTHDGLHLVLSLRKHGVDGLPREAHEVELYDLTGDPACERDLAATRGEDAGRLRARLIDWLDAASAAGWSTAATRDGDQIAELEQLGYAAAESASATSLWVPDDCTWCRRFTR